VHDLEERNHELGGESQGLRAKGEVVAVEHSFFVAVQDQQPEGLLAAMVFIVPFEVSRGREVHLQTAAGQWLRVGLDLHSGDVVHELMQDLAQFGEFGEFSDLLGSHLVEGLPTELLLLLQSAQDVLGDVAELPQRVQTRPHRFVHHFGQFEGALGCLPPPSLEADLEDCPHDAGCRLGNVDFIDVESQSFKSEAGDVGLEKSCYFGGDVFNCALDGDGHSLD
jgi:hypothetical protein